MVGKMLLLRRARRFAVPLLALALLPGITILTLISTSERYDERERIGSTYDENSDYAQMEAEHPFYEYGASESEESEAAHRFASEERSAAETTVAAPQPRPPEPGTTLVTGLFDIGRAGWPTWRRDVRTYVRYMRAVLAAPAHLIVFCAPRQVCDAVRRGRWRQAALKRRPPGTAFKLRPLQLTQLPLHRHLATIESILERERRLWKAEWDKSTKRTPEAFSAPYIMVVNSKAYLTAAVAQMNPFNTTHFAWIDAGYGHGGAVRVRPSSQNGAAWHPEASVPRGKIGIIVHAGYDIGRLTMDDLYRKQSAPVAGGFFIGDREAVSALAARHDELLGRLLAAGYADDDQTLLAVLMTERPELFRTVVGDWFDAFALFGAHDAAQPMARH